MLLSGVDEKKTRTGSVGAGGDDEESEESSHKASDETTTSGPVRGLCP